MIDYAPIGSGKEDSESDKILKPIKAVLDLLIPLLRGYKGIPAQVFTIAALISGVLAILIQVF